MNLYHLEVDFYALDLTTNILVYAYDEDEARQLAYEHDGHYDYWLDKEKVSVTIITLPPIPEVVFSFFTPA